MEFNKIKNIKYMCSKQFLHHINERYIEMSKGIDKELIANNIDLFEN